MNDNSACSKVILFYATMARVGNVEVFNVEGKFYFAMDEDQ